MHTYAYSYISFYFNLSELQLFRGKVPQERDFPWTGDFIASLSTVHMERSANPKYNPQTDISLFSSLFFFFSLSLSLELISNRWNYVIDGNVHAGELQFQANSQTDSETRQWMDSIATVDVYDPIQCIWRLIRPFEYQSLFDSTKFKLYFSLHHHTNTSLHLDENCEWLDWSCM